MLLRIKRAFISLAVLLISGGVYAQPVIPTENIADGVVYVRLLDAGGGLKSRGSGFLMNKNGFIMTAKHLFEKMDKTSDTIMVSLRSKSNTPIPASLYTCENDADLCVLYIHSRDVEVAGIKDYFAFHCADFTAGDVLMISGYPLGEKSPSITVPGSLSSSDRGEGMRMYMAAPILPGMSGGPVFNKNVHVVGVVYGAAEGLPLSTFTPIIDGAGLLLKVKVPCPTEVPKAPAGPAAAMPRPTPGTMSMGVVVPGTGVDTMSSTNSFSNWSEVLVSRNMAKDASAALPRTPTDPAEAPTALERIYFHVNTEAQKRDAEGKAIPALASEKLPVEPRAQRLTVAPSRAEIRYSEGGKSDAERVKKIIESAIGGSFELKKINGAPGIVEVWMQKQT